MSSITFLGDVWLPRPFKSSVEIPGEFVFNLESPITKTSNHASGKICLKSETNFVTETFGKKPIAVCLANNHIMDYGVDGFADTLTEMDKSGIRYFGAGTLEQNCRNPLMLHIGANRVALLGYVCPTTHPIFATKESPGVMLLSLEQISADVLACRQNGASRVIVHLHWGMEEVHMPRLQDINIAHRIAEMGADLIIGHHSHCIQSCEYYSGKPIFYGIGNCIFPDFSASEVRGGYWKKQRFWNRRSLAICYDLTSASVTPRGLCFSGDHLKTASFNPAKWQAEFVGLNESNYQQRHQRHVRFTSLRSAASRFLARPKLPRWHHLRILFGGN